MKKLILIIAAAFTCILSGCENDIDPGQTNVMKLSNEWFVHLLVEDGNGGYEDIYEVGYFRILTSSTASPTADSIFVDDFGAVAELKAKVACNPKDLTFGNSGTPVLERYTDGEVFINNGKVYEGLGSSITGVTVDSLYFEVQFDWDPGQVYIIAGHGRTGFIEDEPAH